MLFIKKHSKMLISIIILLSLFLIYKQNNTNNINYTAIGDSLTLGKNSFGIIDYSYADYFNDYLTSINKNNVYIKEFSDKYITMPQLQNNIINNQIIIVNNKKYYLKQTLRETNILTIQVGLNDLKYKISLSEIESDNSLNRITNEIEEDYHRLIKEIKKYYQQDIYVIGYYYTGDNYIDKGIDKLNNIFLKDNDVIYIPIDTIMTNPKYFSNSNSYYPNRDGYKEISLQIQKKITKKLEK